jgi:hypothetical protein
MRAEGKPVSLKPAQKWNETFGLDEPKQKVILISRQLMALLQQQRL